MSRGTLDPACRLPPSDTGLSPSPGALSRAFSWLPACAWQSEPRDARIPVWALSISLAATLEIDVSFSSSPYLDVSVQAVPHRTLFDSCTVDRVWLCRVSPFGYLRINAYLQLPEAFRSLSRPSSAPDAKAFPLRSSSLDLVGFSIRFVPFPPSA